MNFAKLNELLIINHISRRKLAILAGLSPTTLTSVMVSNRQTGIVNESVYIKRFASILNVPYHELLTEKELSEMRSRGIDVTEDLLNEFTYSVKPKFEAMIDKLNLLGIKRLVEIAEDLTEIPRYQRRK